MIEAKVCSRTLVCFDFDLTLTDQHLFRAVTQMIQSGVDREQACLKAIKYLDERGPRGGDQLWSILSALLMKGHGVAICTFSSYPELAMALWQRGVKALRQRGASREATAWLSRPIVVYGDPAIHLRPPAPIQGAYLVEVGFGQMASHGKQIHIQRALEIANLRLESSLNSEASRATLKLLPAPNGMMEEAFSAVILVDDDPRNIDHAQRAGQQGIFVATPQEGNGHLEQLSELLGLSV